MITKRSTLLLVLAILGCLSLSQAASKNDKLKEEKEENRSKELVNNAAGFKTKNINKTIARVEAMLAKNPQLPRLTRGEIIALLDNITRTDELQKVNKGGNEDKRRREEKSLLVVLPFIPYNESSKAGMEELYTMEPMTKFVTEGTTPSGERMKSKNSDKNPDFLIDMSAASSSERAQVVESSIRFENPPSSSSTTNKIPVTTPTPTPHKRRRKPSSMKPIIVAPQEQRPVYVHKGKTSTSTQPPSDSEESSVEWRPYTAYDSPSVLTQRPSTVKLPLPDKSSSEEDPNIPKNHKPEGHQVFVTMPQLIMSSSSAPAYQTRSTTSQPVEIVTPRTVGTTKRPRKKPKTTTTRTTSKEVDDQEMFSGWKPAVGASFNKPEKKHKTTTTSTPMPMPDISVAAENLPADMKKILGSLGLMPGEADETQKYQSSMEKPTIPTSPIDFKPLNPVIDPSSYVSFKRIPDKVQNSNKGGGVMDNDMKQILASFGLMSESGNNYNRRGKLLEDDGAEGRMMGNSDSDEQEEGYEEVKKKPHTNFTLKDINTDALSDEMKDMLSDLGVLRGSNSKRRNGKGHIFNPVTQSALLENPEQAERISKVLIDIKKLSEDNKTHQLNPEEIRAHLYNITAAVLNSSEDEDKKLNANPGLNSISNGWNSQEAGNDEEIKFGGDQTFDGYEPDEEELLRIQNNHKFGSSDDIGSAPSSSFFPEKDDDDSVSTTRYLGIFNKSLQSMNGQPDPLSNEELRQQQDSYKNEVKRQQPDNSTSTTSETSLDTTSEASVTTSEAPESSSVEESSRSAESSSSTTEASTTTSEEPSPSSAEDSVPAEANEPTMTPSTTTADSSNIRDLEESFGGDTPTQRPNGLYFLLDWNSFLRVGQDNRTVNLSFSPKVGDPRNFIQVNVP